MQKDPLTAVAAATVGVVAAARATRLVTKAGPVSQEDIMAEFGTPPADLVLPEWIHEWRASSALPGSRTQAPHLWNASR